MNNFRIIAVKLVNSLSGFHTNCSSYRQVENHKMFRKHKL